MIGKVVIVYPSGNFLVWFEGLKLSARCYISQLDAPVVAKSGEEYDFVLSDGNKGRIVRVAKLHEDHAADETALGSHRRIAYAAASR